MPGELKVSIGQHSDKGRKEINQDYCGASTPREPQLSAKGVAIALADGVSSSDVSHVASRAAVTGFLEDYFCTSETWSVKKSAERVLTATNSWLYSQTRRSQYRYDDAGRGYVCTLSALVLKSATAHVFHVGDSRVCRVQGRSLEPLTEDHRLRAAGGVSYLARALGITSQLEIDYQALPLEQGQVFVLLTDGVYEFVGDAFITATIDSGRDDLNAAAKRIVEEAFRLGSDDNLSVQIARIDELPVGGADEAYLQLAELPFPPVLEARTAFDGYRIVRGLHSSSRSHVYLAVDAESNEQVVLKTPSIDLQGNAAHLERLLMEEWIARRINNPHVLKPVVRTRKRNFVYIATEHIEGRTLKQWLIDHPKPDLETVRGIVEQIAKGLQSFHRLEMLHQDLRPDNIMIDTTGTAKIIDFGSTRVAGIAEVARTLVQPDLLGTVQFTAPECFVGEPITTRSDIFSLGVIAYQMLTGRLPFGADAARVRSRTDQKKLRYRPVRDFDPAFPPWIDAAIQKAVHPDPHKRYEELSEFTHDLRHPNAGLLRQGPTPLLERNPLLFWKGVSLVLAIIVIMLLFKGHSTPAVGREPVPARHAKTDSPVPAFIC